MDNKKILGLGIFIFGYLIFLFIVGSTGLYSLKRVAILNFSDTPWSKDNQRLEIKAELPLILFFQIHVESRKVEFQGVHNEATVTTIDTPSLSYNAEVEMRLDKTLQKQINIGEIKYSPNRKYYAVRLSPEGSNSEEIYIFDSSSDELIYRITPTQLVRATRIMIFGIPISFRSLEIISISTLIIGFSLYSSYTLSLHKLPSLYRLLFISVSGYLITNFVTFLLWLSHLPP